MTKSRKVLSIILAVVMAFAALPMMFASAEDVVTIMSDVATAVETATYEAIGSTSAETAATSMAAVVAELVDDEDVTVEITTVTYTAYTAAVEAAEAVYDTDGTTVLTEAVVAEDAIDGSYVFTVTLAKDTDTATTGNITVVVGAASLLDTVDGAVSFIDSLIASITEFIDMIKAFFLALDIITLIF